MSTCIHCKLKFEGQGEFCCHSCELVYNWINEGRSPLKQVRPQTNGEVQSWQKYDSFELDRLYNHSISSEQKRFRLYIAGLQCSSCVHLLEELPSFEKCIFSARLNYSQQLLEVDCSVETNLGDVCRIVDSLGYKVTPIKESTDMTQARLVENREDLKRIGVAAAVAGNEMLFAVPLYAGLAGDLASAFKWISFVIFLPVVFYSARPFYKTAWLSLVSKRLSVDIMIIVALWSGFIFSTYNLVLGGSEIYFDSTAGFIFLILLTRYLIKKYQNKMIEKNILGEMFEGEIYRVSGADGRTSYATFDELRSGQSVVVSQHQRVPCDSELLSDSIECDLAFLNGETFPHRFLRGETLFAGSRLLSSQAELRILSAPSESKLAKSLNELSLSIAAKNRYQSTSDRLAHWLTAVVFSVAGIFFILAYSDLGTEAFKRSLALITVACPCAIAFGGPLAQSLGMRKAFRMGFLIRSENLFEKLVDIKKVIFDKTGTLTSEALSLQKVYPPTISEMDKSIILGLEKNSFHPVAMSLKKSWSQTRPIEILNSRELPGVGVVGIWNGDEYQLVKSQSGQDDGFIQVSYIKNGKSVGYLFFEETLKLETPRVIEALYSRDYEVKLLTGDKRNRALEIARKIAIRPMFVFSDQSADSKQKVIQKENPCLYAGDGLNDLQALSEAHVSFAVRGPLEATMQYSDVYAPQKSIASILELFDLAKKIYRVMQLNLIFAIFYNCVGGILALLGFVNPLVAAVLMPISSFVITSHTVWRLK